MITRRRAWGCAWAALAVTHGLAAEQTFTCRNWLNYDWPRTLLHYDIEAERSAFLPGRMELTDRDGTPVEYQVVALEAPPGSARGKGRVSFYAQLAKDEAWSYRFAPSQQPATFPAHVSVTQRPGMIEVVSPEAGVRLPPPGEKRFDPPVDPKDVPPR